MTCKELVELVTDYFEEALSAEDQERFEAHLASCGYCRRYIDQMRVTIQVAGVAEKPEVPATLTADVMALFRDWKQKR